ncbi:MAG TPA: hypothetical protein VIK53_07510 [Verrucomicrobiae bacterium]
MKPKLILCLALILSAVILNVLVAWGCVLWSPYKHFIEPQEKADNTMPGYLVGPDNSLDWWFTSTGFGVFESMPCAAHVTEGGEYFRRWAGSVTPAYYRCGWPLLSMQSLVKSREDSQGRELVTWQLSNAEILHRGLQTSKLAAWLHAQEERRLPIVPLWIGFVCNTLFYFLVLLGLFSLWKRFHEQSVNSSFAIHPSSFSPA